MKYFKIPIVFSCFFFFVLNVEGQKSIQNNQIIEEGSNNDNKSIIPKYQHRLQYYSEIRALNDPDAPINYTAYKRKIFATEKKERKNTQSSNSRSNSGKWQSDGPALFDEYTSIGRVNRIKFHPTNPSIIYSVTAGGGLWYTPNHGVVWYPLTDNIPNMNLSGVVIDQYDPDILYVLTGDGDGMDGGAYSNFAFGKFSNGVLKSTDHGTTWFQTGLSFDQTQRIRGFNLIEHPINAGILFVSASNGIHRTSNYGITWNNVLPNTNIYEVEFKPDDSQVAYAVDRENFYKSINGGITWDITATIPGILGAIGRMTISTCANDPEKVYLYATPRNDSLAMHRGVFLSNDAGQSFTKIDSTSNLDGSADQGNYDLTIKCSGVNSDNLIIGKVRSYNSTDGGASFSYSDGIHADHHDFAINPLLPGRLYAATDGGIYYSDDFGETNTWTYLSEYMRITQYYKIAVGQTNPQMVIGGSQDNGTHINYDADAVYYRAFANDGMDCAIHPSDDNLVILSSQNGDFEISSNAGASTSHLIDENDIDEDDDSAWVTPVAWDPADTENIYFGYKPIYRTFNGGSSFSVIADTVGGRVFLHVGTEDPGKLYASDRYTNSDGNREFHMHRSDDYSANWVPIHTNMADSLLSRRKSCVTTNPDDSDEVWVTFAGFLDSVKVFRSMDGGDTWENESGSLPNIPINCIIQEDTNNNPSGAVYIGTDVGVYYKNDDLGDWIQFSNDMPAVEVSDLDIQYSSGTLYAGTYGRGIWTSELYSDCPNEYILNMNTLLHDRDYFFQANDSIALHDYTIESINAHMKLKSNNVILISEGFVAKTDNGNLFKARLSPCSGGIESLKEEDVGHGKN